MPRYASHALHACIGNDHILSSPKSGSMACRMQAVAAQFTCSNRPYPRVGYAAHSALKVAMYRGKNTLCALKPAQSRQQTAGCNQATPCNVHVDHEQQHNHPQSATLSPAPEDHKEFHVRLVSKNKT
jgi:hypothetical protein